MKAVFVSPTESIIGEGFNYADHFSLQE
ncbi:hypothetical protein PENVUL_c083G06395 [Penicillium vulpinum]|uniref:Uncharacterized protein n=1 Tax=Penicillium vulpinum TaxID=29845 RepID=A0A1V6R878_9EURO|nr:hypothetical protein PENVUL_c083G06395 [Penicillium vulpinum]